MQQKHVLIVEDEAPIRDMIRFALERADFSVVEAEDAQSARLAMADHLPDLILLDWMLPGISGAELAREWRRDELTQNVAIIMVTARVDEDDRVRGLNIGADDYVTKPFSSSELIARVRAVLRRSLPGGEDECLEFEGLSLDAASQRVSAGADAVRLGPTEYRLLRFFMSNPERVYSREQMLDRVWGQNVYVEERTVDVHIRRLRKALAPHGFDRFIQTVRGSGYRFSSKSL
ncbi:MAG: phosphate regulon transcriptional regulatory protein PhoB [Xanthomonadales bacterium]|nr:phosphate regulon transcriptional regulatory protein PhoB [Xanthomonadales bacterium]